MALMTLDSAPTGLLTMVCLVTFMFQFTIGPLAPLFAAEICCDVALGAVMVTEDIFVLLQDFVTPPLLTLTPVLVFCVFAIFSLGGVIFVFYFVPETKGLSEQEKKALFLPGSPFGRKLKAGENQLSYGLNPNATNAESTKPRTQLEKSDKPLLLEIEEEKLLAIAKKRAAVLNESDSSVQSDDKQQQYITINQSFHS